MIFLEILEVTKFGYLLNGYIHSDFFHKMTQN